MIKSHLSIKNNYLEDNLIVQENVTKYKVKNETHNYNIHALKIHWKHTLKGS